VAFRTGSRTGKSGKVTQRIAAACTITHTHLPTLKAIQLTWGGNLYIGDMDCPSLKEMANVRQQYILTWARQEEVVNMLKAVQPYSITKRDQIDLFLEEYIPTMMHEGRGYFMTQAQRDKRVQVKERLAALKAVEFKVTGE
jgi:hypothetical protein